MLSHVLCVKETGLCCYCIIIDLLLDLPLTETPLPRVACWGTGDSGLHPRWICLLLHLPLPPPATAHLPGHADLCIRETIPALLLHCRAAYKNTGPQHKFRASKTKWTTHRTASNTHIVTPLTTPGTYTLFRACAGLSHNTCWISALYIARWACIFTFASSDSAARTVHTDWLTQSNSEPCICLRISYRSSQAKRIQSVWDAHTARSFYAGQWTSVNWTPSQVEPAQMGALPLSEDQACSAWDPLRGTTAAPLVKCLLLTWVKMFPNKTVHKSAFALRKSANQQDVVGHYLVAGLSKDIYIYFFYFIMACPKKCLFQIYLASIVGNMSGCCWTLG